MTDSTAATGLKVQRWDSKYYTEALNANIYKPYMGTSENSIIQLKEDLTKKKGDRVTFALVNKLTGAGTTGSAILEGNEEKMDSRSFPVAIDQYRNAVSIAVLEEQFSAIPLRDAGKSVLMDWSTELTRDQITSALHSVNGVAYAAASEANKDVWLTDNADRVLFGSAKSNGSSNDHSASLLNIDNAADKLSASALSLMKRMAKSASPRIKPLKPRSGGVTSDSFIMFAPSLLVRDLANDAVFVQANREARQRGKLNPIFSGADYIYDNIAIIEVEDIPVVAGSGAGGIDVAPCFLCGVQAVGYAIAKRAETKEEKFDYEDKQGIAVRHWHGIEKMLFGSGVADTDDTKDHGVLTGYFASVADA